MSQTRKQHVVIVGGGMAGLMAAREMLLSSQNDELRRLTLVEASDHLGGRIRGNTTFIPNHVVDIGAEYIHGKQTILTELITEYETRTWRKGTVTREAVITAHADGGPFPFCGSTNDGYYGRYYINNELMEGNDERLEPLHTILESLGDEEASSVHGDISIGDVLKKRLPDNNSKSLHDMAVAGYANTIGCTNLNDVSLQMIQRFEAHWGQHEVEGDLHMDSRIGVYGIVEALVKELQTRDSFEAKLNWPVVKLQQDPNGGGVEITSRAGDTLRADAVIITVPPPMLTKIGVALNERKLESLQYIGFDTAIKFILKFSSRLWPQHLESIICAGCLVPEMWFHSYEDESCYTATCFLTSDCARDFYTQTSDGESGCPCTEKAANLVMDQLSTMLQVPFESFREAYMESLLFDWSTHPFVQGGYMYPKLGALQRHLEDLAEPDGSLFFAGEATNTNACCTIQAAMETGVRAARQVEEYLSNQ